MNEGSIYLEARRYGHGSFQTQVVPAEIHAMEAVTRGCSEVCDIGCFQIGMVILGLVLNLCGLALDAFILQHNISLQTYL